MQPPEANTLLDWLQTEPIHNLVKDPIFQDPLLPQDPLYEKKTEAVDQFACSILQKADEVLPKTLKPFASTVCCQLKEIFRENNHEIPLDKIIHSLFETRTEKAFQCQEVLSSIINIGISKKKSGLQLQADSLDRFSEIFKMNKEELATAVAALDSSEMALLAQYIEHKKLKVQDLPANTNWELLGKYLTYVDLRGVEEASKIQLVLTHCSKARTVYVNHRRIISLPNLPYCTFLDCSECSRLKKLPNLPSCSFLNCENCKSLESLPPLLFCIELNCTGCRVLKELPELFFCATLECNNCDKLRELPNLPNCISLYCADCPLEKLPELLRCVNLDCTRCTRLKGLPRLPLCEILVCQECRFSEIPDLPRCKTLVCRSCENLKRIGSLLLCEILSCSNCTNLIMLYDELPALKQLFCENCINFVTLPQMPQCIFLNCQGCQFLSFIPHIPLCKNFNYIGCMRLVRLPQVAHGCNVIAKIKESAFVIDPEEIITTPKKILNRLRKRLVNNPRVLEIRYRSQGKEEITLDRGGVSRDFISSLCENLFKGVGTEFLKLEDGIPSMRKGEESCYQIVGKILALCYPSQSRFKTGPLFAEKTYECLTRLPQNLHEESLNEWFLKEYLTFSEVLTTVGPLIFLEEVSSKEQVPFSEIPKKTLEFLSYTKDPIGISKITEEEYCQPLFREKIRAQLLKVAREDSRLLAILHLQRGMFSELKESERQEIVKGEPKKLREQIEGLVDPYILLQRLKCYKGPDVSDENFQETKCFLERWILEAGESSLRELIRAVTGNNALMSGDWSVYVYSTTRYPKTSTCAICLYLPAINANQQEFNEKLEYLLKNTGFQLP